MHSVWHASLRTYQFVGGNEVFKQYFQTNQASGNGPGPAALGAHGLADAWTYTKADDDYEVTYWLYGDSEYSTHHKGNDPPATGCPVHKRSSQAKAYVTLYDNDFFAGKELTRLIRRGGDSKKGTVAKVMICPPANADAATGQAEAWPAIAIAKGAKVMQSAGAGVPITGKLWRAVQLNDREIWVELLESDGFNGGSAGSRCRFKPSTKSHTHTIVVGEGDESFEANIMVKRVTVYTAVVADEDIDPRLSPVVPVPKDCSPFLAFSDELRNDVHALSCLSEIDACIKR